ncbi:MAG: hypothetical protein ACI4WS_11610 [Oscillospiraceae bacterium]
MSGLKPIPAALLTDCVELRTPTASGYSSADLTSVRVTRTSAITDYAAGRTRDCTELVMYFDCVNSEYNPASGVGEVEFAAGQTLVYCGESFEITSVELFCGTAPHHYKIKARKTGGEFTPE